MTASRDRVIAMLRRAGAISRADIARSTALSRATVSGILSELEDEGLIVQEPEAPAGGSSRTGRPPALIRLNSSAGTVLGLDFGKRHLRVAVADLGHNVLAERAVEVPDDHSAEEGMTVAVQLVDEVIKDAGIDRASLVGAGMGLPGPINSVTGRLGSSTILPGWVGLRAAEAMSQRLGMPVQVDNDANLGALAEWMWGAARGHSDVVYLKVATGIGAGLVLDGHPYRGSGGTAGELGHTIIDPTGPVCRCGNRGCLETFVGAAALLDLLRPTLGELTQGDLVARAADGDAGCRRVIHDAGLAIGGATATLCNLLNPACIVVGGDLAAAGELLLGPIRESLKRAAIPTAGTDATVVAGVFRERAEVVGAIALAIRHGDLLLSDRNNSLVAAG